MTWCVVSSLTTVGSKWRLDVYLLGDAVEMACLSHEEKLRISTSVLSCCVTQRKLLHLSETPFLHM